MNYVLGLSSRSTLLLSDTIRSAETNFSRGTKSHKVRLKGKLLRGIYTLYMMSYNL